MAKSVGIQPRGDRVVVEPLSKDEVSVSGIIIPDTVKGEKSERGTVLAIGPGKFEKGTLVPVADLKVGDVVLFEHVYGDPTKVDGKECYIISESQIIAVIPKK